MWAALLVLAFGAAVALDDHGGSLGDAIQAEVQLILASEPTLTVDECTDRCDAEFNLAFEHSEKASDHQCRSACFHQLKTTQAGYSHRPHHTHVHTTEPPTTVWR